MSKVTRLHRFTLTLLIALVVFTFFSQAALTFAQSGDDSSSAVEITGKVTRVDGLTITIGGVTFDISQAELYGSFAVGDVVKIKVMVASDGALVVSEVAPVSGDDNSNDNTADNTNDNADDNGNDNADDNSNDNSDDFDDDEVKLSGVITEVGDGYIVVSGLRITIADAQIEGDLTVGAAVEVKLNIIGDEYVASELKPASDDDDVLPAECVITAPQGWTSYAIEFGDTLSGIAVGSGAKLADLIASNCIANPNSIAVGTIIFVPQEPVMPDNSNDNSDDDSNDNGDDSNDNSDDSNDNGDDSNDNGDDSNDNGDDSNDNSDDDSNDNGDDSNDNGDDSNDNSDD